MKLTRKHIMLYKELLSQGIRRQCSDTDPDLYSDRTPEEIYELNHKA